MSINYLHTLKATFGINQGRKMNMREALMMCYSIPLLGCAMETLIHFFSSSSRSPDVANAATIEGDRVAAADNRAAQANFRQVQHIRTA